MSFGSMQQNRWQRPAAILVALTASALLYVEIPAPSLLSEVLWELGHVLLFGFLALLWLRWRDRPQITVRVALLLMGSAVVLALLSELGQVLVGRNFAFRDIAFDAAGVALVLIYEFRSYRTERISLAAVITLLVLTPLLWTLFAYHSALRQWPVIVDTDQPGAGVWFSGDAHSKRVPAAGRLLQFRKGKFSGFYVTAADPDWRYYSYLRLFVTNPGSEPLTLHCQVSDRLYELDSGNFADRYDTQFELRPGPSELEIELAVAKFGPVSRQLEFDNMRGFGCYLRDAVVDSTLLLRRVILE